MHAAPQSADAYELQTQPASPLVVLAQSDPERRAVTQMLLLDAGYDVVVLDTGSQLLQYLYNSVAHEARPDLVVCDAELEGIDGAQVCKISRSQDTLLPFIVLARPGPAGAFDSMELNDDACVFEPDVEPETLMAEVLRLAGHP